MGLRERLFGSRMEYHVVDDRPRKKIEDTLAVRLPNIVSKFGLDVRRTELGDFPGRERTALPELLIVDRNNKIAAVIDIIYLPDGYSVPWAFPCIIGKRNQERGLNEALSVMIAAADTGNVVDREMAAQGISCVRYKNDNQTLDDIRQLLETRRAIK